MNALAIPVLEQAPACVWFHTDERGADVAGSSGLRRALSGDWASGPLDVRVDDFRGYLLAHAYARASLLGAVSEREGMWLLNPAVPENARESERGLAALVMQRTTDALASGDPLFRAWRCPRAVVTEAGRPLEVAALPALALVAVAVAGAAALAYVANQAAQVVDNFMARKQTLAQIVQADAQVTELVTGHVDRERKEGKALPLDAATKAALGELSRRQEALRKQTTPPIKSGIEGAGSGFGLGAAIAAAALAAALFLTKG